MGNALPEMCIINKDFLVMHCLLDLKGDCKTVKLPPKKTPFIMEKPTLKANLHLVKSQSLKKGIIFSYSL